MRVVVSADGNDLEATLVPTFGRSPAYVFVDSDTWAFEAGANPAANAAGGAGIRAARFVIERGAQAVVTGSVGPNAIGVLDGAGVPAFRFGGGTVRQAVQALLDGGLQTLGAAAARPTASPQTGRDAEIAALQDKAAQLRHDLAEVMERLTALEEK